tara:strand:+ start:15535 stop:15768 length:234 start_codon:yes stop_codon:yes gene_type:complete
MESKKDTIGAYPLIMVDGKVAPRLSPLSFHIKNSSESNCLNCHQSEKSFKLNSKEYIPKKIPHEYRENCISCHVIEM